MEMVVWVDVIRVLLRNATGLSFGPGRKCLGLRPGLGLPGGSDRSGACGSVDQQILGGKVGPREIPLYRLTPSK